MDILLRAEANAPYYEQIAEQIRRQILSGALAPGQPLPSIRALAQDLRISVITTKRAYQDLEREGYIETVGGKGSFVSAHSMSRAEDRQRQEVRELLTKAVREASALGLSPPELQRMLQQLWAEQTQKESE